MINSAFRTHRWQAKFLIKKTSTWHRYDETCHLMHLTHSIRNGTHTYMDIKKFRDLVDKPTLLDEYLLSDNVDVGQIRKIKDDTDIANAINKLRALAIYTRELLGSISTNKEDSSWEDVLTKIFTRGILTPSQHPYGRAFDLSISDTAEYIYDNHKSGKYDEGNVRHIGF